MVVDVSSVGVKLSRDALLIAYLFMAPLELRKSDTQTHPPDRERGQHFGVWNSERERKRDNSLCWLKIKHFILDLDLHLDFPVLENSRFKSPFSNKGHWTLLVHPVSHWGEGLPPSYLEKDKNKNAIGKHKEFLAKGAVEHLHCRQKVPGSITLIFIWKDLTVDDVKRPPTATLESCYQSE